MRKVGDGEKKRKKRKEKRMSFLLATTSLPAVYRPNDDRWNAARSCQNCLANISAIIHCSEANLYSKETRKFNPPNIKIFSVAF